MNIPLTVLGIIDGFGYSPQAEGNAIIQAPTPTLDYLWSYFPHYLLKAAEEEVGLAFGEVGNSEVGHISIGTGRVIPQNLSLINLAIEDGSFNQNKAFQKTIQHVKQHNSNLHVMGIISTSGVHGHLNHILAVLELAASQKVKNIYLHLILDGRDSGPRDSSYFLREIYKLLDKHKQIKITSMCGRGIAMDRNNNWERTSQYYNLLLGKSQQAFNHPDEALKHYYNQGLDDENIPPTHILEGKLPPLGLNENDALIFTNFREDRARQITQALSLPAFSGFTREGHPKNLLIATMTSYEKALPVEVAFPPPQIYDTLSDTLSKYQISQIHIAETEKYAHVTYFFNGGRESKRPGEEYFLVPSIKPEQFENQPEMSATAVTQAVIKSIELGYQFIIFNFANCDMVGHTGNYNSTLKAIEIVDQQFKLLWDYISKKNGYLFITADHGNSEQMVDPKTKAIYKKHTISPVPFIIANPSLLTKPTQTNKIMSDTTSISGLLSDVAPTILTQIGLEIPNGMTGTSLL